MRVIAGTARSMPLKTPRGLDTRPTQDRIKETLFNILQNDIPGCVFIDLFAGSGQMGIEALSRGARKAYFAENGKEAAACITENLKFTHLEEKGILLKQDAVSALSNISEKEADIIFLDPPYDTGEEKRVLAALSNARFVTEDTLIIVEASLDTKLTGLEDYGLTVVREKKYKGNQHIFIKKRG